MVTTAGALSRSTAEPEALFQAAREFAPRILELAPRMQADCRLDEALINDMEAAGLFSVLVPKCWGGAGLGPHQANKIVEILGAADCSTGWVTAFYILHNWFLCKFPRETQEALFAKTSSVRTAAVFGPPGKAEKTEGGYRVTGRWGYASGAWHASYMMVPAIVGEAMHWFIVSRDEIELIDDWRMAAMSATGSVTIAADNVLVADSWHWDIGKLMSATDHPGAFHEDVAYRLPFSSLTMVAPSLSLGALDRAVDLAREKLPRSFPLGYPRIKRPAARIRWVEAYQRARILRLIRDAATDEAISRALAGLPQAPEDEARSQLHLVSYAHGIKDAMRLLVDGLGSSGYRTDDPIYRMSQDVSMLATHALGTDYDVVMDRHARWLLDLGAAAGDPMTRIA